MCDIELGLLRNVLREPSLEVLSKLDALRNHVLEFSEYARRLSHQFHPSVLESAGLALALESHCKEFQGLTGVPARFVVRQAPDAIPSPVAICLYRIAQESMRNAAKHSGASLIQVVLTGTGTGLRLTVIDDGRGFEVDQVKARGAGLGLVTMEERARFLNGLFSVQSVPNEGTRIEVEIPLRSADEHAPTQGPAG